MRAVLARQLAPALAFALGGCALLGQRTIETPGGVSIRKLRETEGALPVRGDQVWVAYTGHFPDGRVFERSADKGKPLEFTLGVGQAIPGWDEAFALLREGEKARLEIPARLAYGHEGIEGLIPPDSDVVFEVEVVRVASR